MQLATAQSDAETREMSTKTGQVRSRARKACQICNARRVRCNVMESKPCDNCAATGMSCELMTSRRGKYPRQRGVSKTPAAQPQFVAKAATLTAEFLEPIVTPSPDEDLPTNHIAGNNEISPNRSSPNNTSRSIHDYRPRVEVNSHVLQQPSPSISNDASESDRTVFLGESNLLSCLAGEKHNTSRDMDSGTTNKTKFCYTISDAIRARGSRFESRAKFDSDTIKDLTHKGAFTFPAVEVYQNILQAYFKWFHPCFPIVDMAETRELFVNNTISPLLSQAMLFVGASYCDVDILLKVGFEDRHAAKYQFYRRAKLLYDQEWEENKIVIIQALFLLSFWRAGPSNDKDTRHWLGAAISLAQGRGFHRTTRSVSTNTSHAKIRRRIWWCLYIRDRQCNASLGLPPMIKDADCNIPMLDISDFEQQGDDPTTNTIEFELPTRYHACYTTQMTKLAVLLGKIVMTEFSPTRAGSRSMERSNLKDEVLAWKSELPPEMEIHPWEDSGSIWAYMLHLAYNHLLILLYRSAFFDSDQSPEADVALRAASTSTRMIEDMLSQNLMQYAQVHLITSLFSALCIHTTHLRRSMGFNRTFAEQRSKVCILGLKEMQQTWDVNNWVLQLFFQFLDRSTADKLRVSDFDPTSLDSRTDLDSGETPLLNARTPGTGAEQSGQNVIVFASTQNETENEPNANMTQLISAYNPGRDDNMLNFLLPEEFSMDFDEGVNFNEFFGSPMGGDLSAQGLDFLSRCL